MVPLSAPPITSTNRSNNHHHHHGISLASSNTVNGNTTSTNSIPNSIGLHTPTPFFTPNEQSPKFMNSPVFSYSNPDTSLYQGPFSPIRASSLYPPPSSPFTHLSLNSPLPPLQSSVSSNSSTSSSNSSSNGGNSGGATPSSAGGGGGGGMVGNPCFNMIPSTLLSPAPSQASTNSLSYEDLHEKSLSLFSPAWSIFLPGTKIRFLGGMNSMDWYMADFLAQSGDSLLTGLKGEYAPHGLELRKVLIQYFYTFLYSIPLDTNSKRKNLSRNNLIIYIVPYRIQLIAGITIIRSFFIYNTHFYNSNFHTLSKTTQDSFVFFFFS